jgi:hypothetical protein
LRLLQHRKLIELGQGLPNIYEQAGSEAVKLGARLTVPGLLLLIIIINNELTR